MVKALVMNLVGDYLWVVDLSGKESDIFEGEISKII